VEGRERLLLANNQSELLLIGCTANLKKKDDISDIHCHGAANIKNFQKKRYAKHFAAPTLIDMLNTNNWAGMCGKGNRFIPRWRPN
jgi:hypothetical protein